MLGYISPITNYIEQFLDRPIFINQYTKLFFCSNNPFFYCNPPKNISDKFTLLESFEGFYHQVWSQWLIKLFNVNYERKHKLIVDLWMLIIDASNFTLYSISFILESLLIPKFFLIEQGIVLNSFIFVWFVVVWW